MLTIIFLILTGLFAHALRAEGRLDRKRVQLRRMEAEREYYQYQLQKQYATRPAPNFSWWVIQMACLLHNTAPDSSLTRTLRARN